MSIQLNFQSQLGRVLIDLPSSIARPLRAISNTNLYKTSLMELDLLSFHQTEKGESVFEAFLSMYKHKAHKRLLSLFGSGNISLSSPRTRQFLLFFFFFCLCFEDKGDEFGACVKCQADNGRERSVSFILSAGVTRRAWCAPRSIVLPHRIASSPRPRQSHDRKLATKGENECKLELFFHPFPL